VPVVATCVGGIPEIIENRRTGILVETLLNSQAGESYKGWRIIQRQTWFVEALITRKLGESYTNKVLEQLVGFLFEVR